MKRDPGPGRVLVAAIVVGVLYAQGGVWRTLAGVMLFLAVTARPSGGRSLVEEAGDGFKWVLSGLDWRGAA